MQNHIWQERVCLFISIPPQPPAQHQRPLMRTCSPTPCTPCVSDGSSPVEMPNGDNTDFFFPVTSLYHVPLRSPPSLLADDAIDVGSSILEDDISCTCFCQTPLPPNRPWVAMMMCRHVCGGWRMIKEIS